LLEGKTHVSSRAKISYPSPKKIVTNVWDGATGIGPQNSEEKLGKFKKRRSQTITCVPYKKKKEKTLMKKKRVKVLKGKRNATIGGDTREKVTLDHYKSKAESAKERGNGVHQERGCIPWREAKM